MNFVGKAENFLSENPQVNKFLYFLGFITSGYISFKAMSGNATSIDIYLIWVAYTVVMESGKAVCYLQYVKTGLKKYFYMWIVLTFFSIAASMAFFIIENNNAENKANVSSVAFQQATEKTKRINEQIKIKQNLIDQSSLDKQNTNKLTQEYNQSINAIQREIKQKNSELKDASQKNWITTQKRIKSEIDQLEQKQSKDIKARDSLGIKVDVDKLNAEIDSLNNQLNQIDLTSLPPEKATSGFYPLFQFFSKDREKIFWIEFLFTLALTTTFEILICMMYSLSKKIEPSPTSPNSDNREKKIFDIKKFRNKEIDTGSLNPVTSYSQKFDPNVIDIEKKRTKKLQNLANSELYPFGITEEMIRKYKEEIFKNNRNRIAPSRVKLMNALDLTREQCDGCRDILKDRGIIEVKGNKTILRKVV